MTVVDRDGTLYADSDKQERATSARIIADSISKEGDRVTTFVVRFHRFVLAEFNTHRVFSRNSASSRAIPLRKQLERVRENTAFPVVWPAEQAGMQGGDDLPEDVTEEAKGEWYAAAQDAARHAERLGEMGVHKSVANRLLEPFMWHEVVITASSFENFFGLRCNPQAQPEIRVAAELMEMLFRDSDPAQIGEGGWHLPFVDNDDLAIIKANIEMQGGTEFDFVRYACGVSSARIARVSYLTHDGKRDMNVDMGLYERLSTAWPMHASPMEHPCTPSSHNKHAVTVTSRLRPDKRKTLILPRYGNFVGWHQHRFDVEVEADYQAFA